jgi:hypothetical protein
MTVTFVTKKRFQFGAVAKVAGPVVLGCLLTYVLTNWKARSDNDTRYLDVELRSNDSIVSAPSIPNHKVSLQLDDKPIGSISQVNVAIYNLSDKDYESIPIYIDLTSSDGESLNVLTSSAVGSHGLPETVTEVDVPSGSEPLKQRFLYLLRTANRTTGNEPVFKVNFLVTSRKAPTPVVRIDKAGLETRLTHLAASNGGFTFVMVFETSIAIFAFLLMAINVWSSQRAAARKQAASAQGNNTLAASTTVRDEKK